MLAVVPHNYSKVCSTGKRPSTDVKQRTIPEAEQGTPTDVE